MKQHLESGPNPDWLALRAGRFTASRMADLMAKTKTGPSTSRANLITLLAVERITGQCVETFTNSAMQRGVELEPVARSAYEAKVGSLVEEVAFIIHPELPNVGASPDALVGNDGMLEIKCPAAPAKHLDALRKNSHATEYAWQLQTQLWVSSRDWVDIVSFDNRFPEGLQLAICRVERDPKAIDELREAVIAADEEVSQIVQQLLQLREVTT